MFCNRKHFSLSSGEDINSLDMAGSLERVSLPGRDEMQDHCESVSKLSPVLVAWKTESFVSSAGGMEDSYHHCLVSI